MNKKGSLDDLFVIPKEILLTAIVALFAVVMINKFKDSFILIAPSNATYFVTEGTTYINSLAGYAVVAVFVALMIVSLIAAMQLPTSIIWTPMFAIGTLVAVWIAYPISVAYTEIINSATFATYSTHMAVTTILFSNLTIIILIMGCILSIVTFVKYRGEQIIPP